MRWIRNTCPGCGGDFEIVPRDIGCQSKCPSCGASLILGEDRSTARFAELAGKSAAGARAAAREVTAAYVWRWVGVLPFSMFSYFLAKLLLAPLFGNFFETDPNQPHLLQAVFCSTVQAVLFVITGANLAPSHNRIIAIALAVLHGVGIFVAAWYFVTRDMAPVPVWTAVVCALPPVAATVFACRQFKNDDSPLW